MFVAITAAIVTAVVVFLALGVFFLVRSRKAGTKTPAASASRDAVQQIESVGVESTLEEAIGPHERPLVGADSPNEAPADRVRPRFVAMGVLATAIFGSLAAKLWSLQVLSADTYQNEARQNKYSTVATPAPRGYIYDSNGIALVENRTALTILADAQVAEDHDVITRLSAVLGIPYGVVRARIKDQSSGAQSRRVVASDARLRDVAFIAEHSDAFTGVTVEERTVRTYPYGALAAHVLGYTGTVSEEELEDVPSNRQVELGDTVGKSGIEAYYDNLLAGDHGQRTVVADSQGRIVSVESETPATKGDDIYLTIMAPVQYVAEEALAALIAPEGVIGKGRGVGGAVVAMDVEDGSILAMASFPTYAPETFTGGIAQDIWDLYSTPQSYYPLLNRAISGTYPAASCYKAFTSLAGLKYGFANDKKEWECTGAWDGYNTGDIQHCWDLYGHGDIDLHEGIVVSCDVVFYEIAKDFFYAGLSQGGTISDTAMQEEIAKFGFGQQTGIDLSGEEAGRIPTPEWKVAHWSDVPTEGQWRGGDLTNLVIGQGDVLVTPLQMAVGYAAVATGKLMKPHLFKEARNNADEPVVKFEPKVISEPEVDKKNYDIVRKALNGVAEASDPLVVAFAEQGIDITKVGSKTGTGEVAGKGDVAWFVCYYPFEAPKYLVATCIEEGCGGARIAGPVGAEVLAAVLDAVNGDLDYVGSIKGSNGKSVEYSAGETARTD